MDSENLETVDGPPSCDHIRPRSLLEFSQTGRARLPYLLGTATGTVPRMMKIIHMCLDVRGALMNWSDREMRGVFKDDDGRVLSVREAKDFLMDEIAKGHRVIPIGDCDAFDFETGCPGHPIDSP